MDHFIIMAEIIIDGGNPKYGILGSTRAYDAKALKETFHAHFKRKYPNADIFIRIHSKASVSREEYFAQMPWFLDQNL